MYIEPACYMLSTFLIAHFRSRFRLKRGRSIVKDYTGDGTEDSQVPRIVNERRIGQLKHRVGYELGLLSAR